MRAPTYKPSERAAIGFGDDHVLRHVHQTAGQVTRISRLKGGVGKALTSAVRGDEVLQAPRDLRGS